MVKNLKKERAILADQTDAKRADLSHVQLYADFLHPCPILPRMWNNFQLINCPPVSSFFHLSHLTLCPILPNLSDIYIIIEESWNANLFQLLLVLFHFIFTFTMEERYSHFY